MDTQDIDVGLRRLEEGAHPTNHLGTGLLPDSPRLLEQLVGHVEEEMVASAPTASSSARSSPSAGGRESWRYSITRGASQLLDGEASGQRERLHYSNAQ